jgi:signal transduction histidine kinase
MAPSLRPKRIPWHLLLIFLLLSLGILGTGYFYYDYERAYFKQEKVNELTAIADLKTNQISDWRKERLADATTITKDPFFAARVKYWLEGKANPNLKEEILNYLKSLLIYQYQNIVLLDPKGRKRLSILEERQSPDAYTRALALEAIRNRKIIFSDLYRPDGSQAVRLSILSPILVPQGTGTVAVGTVQLQIDPHQFLYPLIQSWPTPSHSAETELIRREDNEVEILNELRNRKHTALNLRYSLQKAILPAAMAARGKEGVVEGVDYRGMPVMAVVGRIPGSPWYYVTKIDAAEIYAPLRKRLLLVLFLLIVMLATAGVSLASIWSNQQAHFYRRQYEMERDREETLKMLNEELEQRVRERTTQLEATNQELEAFSYSVSHDLRSPLIAIEGFSRMLAERHAANLDAEGRQLFKFVQNNTQLMGQLIDDLLALSRLGRKELRIEELDLSKLTESVCKNLKWQNPDRPLQFTVKPMPAARGDQGLIRQVLVNLLGNAVKFTGSMEKTEIVVGGFTDEDESIYFVRDNGVGFNMKYADKLFDVFNTLHKRKEFKGTGVGLAIVKRIVERHGGRVWAEGKVGEGATFYFSLPKKEN